jgi:hypothetical protein
MRSYLQVRSHHSQLIPSARIYLAQLSRIRKKPQTVLRAADYERPAPPEAEVHFLNSLPKADEGNSWLQWPRATCRAWDRPTAPRPLFSAGRNEQPMTDVAEPEDIPLLPTPTIEDADDEGELAKFIAALTEQP